MNITERIIKLLPYEYKPIVIYNKEIQFYVYGNSFKWHDRRFLSSCDNPTSESDHAMLKSFCKHIDNIDLEFLYKEEYQLNFRFKQNEISEENYCKGIQYIKNLKASEE